MSESIARDAAACQGSSDSPVDGRQGKELSLGLMRDAIEQSGWKHEALAAQMKLPNAAYLSRMLSGEKPWTLRHIEALPDDVEAIYYRLRAESLGFVVVAPLNGKAAVEALAAGLIGMMASAAFPVRANAMLKVDGAPIKVRRRA